jgi:hypothetical protein
LTVFIAVINASSLRLNVSPAQPDFIAFTSASARTLMYFFGVLRHYVSSIRSNSSCASRRQA